MKFAVLALAAAAAIAGVDASSRDSNIHIRVHMHHEKQSPVCYKQCPQGQWCAGGTQVCRAPKPNTSECFNYATGQFIPKCDAGWECKLGKCERATGQPTTKPPTPTTKAPTPTTKPPTQNPGVPGGAICYQPCPGGQWCARGTTTCRVPTAGTTECFDLSQGLWISKCGAGFSCKAGKCA